MRAATTILAVLATAAVTLAQAPVVNHTGALTPVAQPARLAPDGGGGIYVTDPPNDMIVQDDGTGVVVGTFPIPEGPLGVAVLPDGRVFVSRGDGEIGLYDAGFNPLGTVNPLAFTLDTPNDLAVDTLTSELYAVDSGSNQVLVFAETGVGTNVFEAVRMWGIGGAGLGEFHTPQAIMVDPIAGLVYVTDTDNFRVQVFDTVGNLQFKFGYRTLYTSSGDTAWFPRSEGLALDTCGNIYVADAMMGTVRAFNSLGSELDPLHAPVLSFGTGAGQLRGPTDMVIDGFGTMFVASTNNGAVETYDVLCSGAMAAFASDDTPAREMKRQRRRLESETARERLRAHPQTPDNPAEIAQAMFEGNYCRDLDLNSDRVIDELDIEIAVAAFGAGTVQDFHSGTVAAHPSLDPPHILDLADRCGRCHSMDGAPDGGMLTSAGQENLCLSCHSAGKIGNDRPIAVEESGNNHPWGVAADSGSAMGPGPGSDLLLHLDGGDIRCGTCHEPHNSATGPEYIRLSASGADNAINLCGECHEEFDEWLHAGHSHEEAEAFVHYDWALPNRASCRQCHTGNGYIGFADGLPPADQNGEFRVHDCLVCHATHGASQDGELLRIYDEVTLPTVGPDELVTGVGGMATCMACHNGRRAPDDGSLTPHYMLGGVMLEGINGNEFGYTIESSAHTLLGVTCMDCHMAPSPTSGPGAGKVGGHTFNLKVHDPSDPDYEFENVVNSCQAQGCHGPTVTSINRLAYFDYDGNGVIEGVQDETQGLLDMVYDSILAAGAVDLGSYPYWSLSAVDPLEVDLVRAAIWNWQFVINSGDLGVKNTGYTVGLLQVTHLELGGAEAWPVDARRYTP